MKAKPFAIIGTVMLVIGFTFFFYAINHPEMGTPFSLPLDITRLIYKIYLAVTLIFLLIAVIIKIIKAITK